MTLILIALSAVAVIATVFSLLAFRMAISNHIELKVLIKAYHSRHYAPVDQQGMSDVELEKRLNQDFERLIGQQ